jgi:hypothetical protein
MGIPIIALSMGAINLDMPSWDIQSQDRILFNIIPVNA